MASNADETAQRRAFIHNEQAKIRAIRMNTVAAGLLVAGIITPLASAALVGVAISGPLVALMGIWFVAALILHYGALLALETMK